MERKENSKLPDTKLLMCGCHIGGVSVINKLIELGYKFSYFVCLNSQQAKKYNVSGYYDYQEIAKRENIPIYIPEKYSLTGQKDYEFFNTNKFDVLVQGGWQRLFPECLINQLKHGALGFHGSPDFLPKGRGRSPMNWSLVLGKKRFIMSLFLIKPGIDDGDIIDYIEFDINEYDDIQTLYYKYSITNRDLVVKNLPNIISGDYNVIPQSGIPSYFDKRTENDGEINWEEKDVYEIHNLIRATTKPYPGAFGKIKDKKIRIWKSRIFDTRLKYPKSEYGEIVERFENHLIINCRGGLLLAEEYNWEWSDIANNTLHNQ